MCVWRGQQELLIWSVNNAPEARLEALRQFVVQAAWMLDQAAKPANSNTMPGAMPSADPMSAPPMPGQPVGPAPVAALAPQAMDLMAG